METLESLGNKKGQKPCYCLVIWPSSFLLWTALEEILVVMGRIELPTYGL